jgi:hypothetical protein
MQLNSIPNPGDAHAQLVLQLCDALSAFVAATTPKNEARARPPREVPANDYATTPMDTFRYDDVISLRGLLLEFGLKQPQVAKLRQRWGFPDPIGRARPMMFRRPEVERWVQSQPNPSNPAIVLRSRKRR